jgi:fibronectin type 3 domain-containing protein
MPLLRHSAALSSSRVSRLPYYVLLVPIALLFNPCRAFEVQAAATSGSVSFVQQNSATPQSSPKSVSVAFNSAQNAGDLNVVAIGWSNSTSTISSVTDSIGNTYTLGAPITSISRSASQAIYYAANISAAAAGTNTVKVTFSSSAPDPDVRILEYAGAALSSPLDVTSSGTGTNATSATPAVSTTNAYDLLFAANYVATLTTGAGSGFTSRVITSPDGDIAEDEMVGVTGSYSGTAPLSSSGWWIMQMVAFKAASSSGGGASDPAGPTAPSNLIATAASATQINLSWTASTDPAGVTGYSIQRCSGSGCSSFAQVASVSGTTTTYSNTSLSAATSYSYRVQATDAAGYLSAFSNTASATTQADPPPTAPSNLTATAASATQINLSWTASTDQVGVTGYNIQRCSGSGCSSFLQVANVSGTTTTYSDTSLTAATSYSYHVQATDAAGNLSAFSNTASATTEADPPPTAPSNLTATAASATQINLSWTASTDQVGVTGYDIQRCSGSGCSNFAQVTSVSGTTTSYSDTSLTAATSYSYRVQATDAAGNLSAFSNTASATTASSSAPTTIAFVQQNSATPQSSPTSVAVKFTTAQTAGDLNVVAVGWSNSTSTISSVVDSSGNAYTLAGPITTISGTAAQAIYYAANISAAAAGANTVTVTFNTAAPDPDVRILEYAGAALSSPMDVTSSGTGTNATSASPAVSTTNAYDLLFAANYVATRTTGAGSGFTSRVITSPDGDIAEDEMVTATGSYSGTAPLSSSGWWIMQMVAFKAAGSAGTGGTPTITSIAVTPQTSSIPQGNTQQYVATGTYSNGTTQNLTTTAAWASSNSSVATIGSSSGLATGVGAGTAQITATMGSIVSSPATLTVTSSSGSSGGSGSATVELVQHVSSSNTRDNDFGSPYCYYFQLPNYTTAGNAVVVGFTFQNNPTPSVSDDQGNSYSLQVNYFDSADSQSIGIATALNVVAGARVISLCFSSDPGGYVQPMASEFANVVAVDGSGIATHGSGTAVSPGSLTPSASGDLAYQVVYSLSTNQSSFTAGSQSNISWNLLSADLMDGWAAQFGQYNSTSSLAPSLSMGRSEKWLSAAILLQSGTSGAVPSGMRIVHLVHENIPEHTSSGGTGNPFPNPLPLQLPSSGNLLVAMMGGGNNSCTITSITDTNSNTWSQIGATEVIAGNDTVQAFYAGNAASSTNLALTVNWSATDGDFTILFYDVAGAASSPLDTSAGGTGYQQNASNLTLPFTVTPSEAGELILADTVWDYNTGDGMLPSGSLDDTNLFSGESQSGPEPVDENNNWGHLISTGTGSIDITWEVMYSGLPVNDWAGMAVAFKPAP